jgi:ketol-acid reductoisomerase
MIGVQVRELYMRGSGALAQVAVHQDASGQAWERLLALCKGMGLTRGGVFRSTFREEAELDLFAEQVIWAGLEAWFLECFELGVAHGFSPELMVMELYASGETAQIFANMAKNGFCSLWPCVTRPVRFCGESTTAALSASGAASRRGGRRGWKRCVLLPWLTR